MNFGASPSWIMHQKAQHMRPSKNLKTKNLQLFDPSAVKKQLLTLDPVGELLRSTIWPIFFENSEQRKLGYVLGFLPKHREIPNKIEPR